MKPLLLLILLCASLPLFAKTKQPLLFIVNYPGSPPYLYFDEKTNAFEGVIPDLLKELIESKQLSIKYISNSRKRSEEYMYQGTADLLMLSKNWLKNPDKLISTIAFHQHRSFLYKANPFPDEFSLDNAIQGETVCTKKGYSYPNLAPYFKSKRLVRVDSSSHLSMLRLLFKDRCDYTVMNEFNALNLINSKFFTDKKTYRSTKPVSTVPLNIILRAEFTEEKELLDKHIATLLKNNEIQRLVDKHTY